MDLEKEKLRLKLIETQMALLQYQHREVAATIDALTKAQDESVSAHS